jgi:hypothetical protein
MILFSFGRGIQNAIDQSSSTADNHSIVLGVPKLRDSFQPASPYCQIIVPNQYVTGLGKDIGRVKSTMVSRRIDWSMHQGNGNTKVGKLLAKILKNRLDLEIVFALMNENMSR